MHHLHVNWQNHILMMKTEEEKEKIMVEARERDHNKDHSLVILNLAIHESTCIVIITYI